MIIEPTGITDKCTATGYSYCYYTKREKTVLGNTLSSECYVYSDGIEYIKLEDSNFVVKKGTKIRYKVVGTKAYLGEGTELPECSGSECKNYIKEIPLEGEITMDRGYPNGISIVGLNTEVYTIEIKGKPVKITVTAISMIIFDKSIAIHKEPVTSPDNPPSLETPPEDYDFIQSYTYTDTESGESITASVAIGGELMYKPLDGQLYVYPGSYIKYKLIEGTNLYLAETTTPECNLDGCPYTELPAEGVLNIDKDYSNGLAIVAYNKKTVTWWSEGTQWQKDIYAYSYYSLNPIKFKSTITFQIFVSKIVYEDDRTVSMGASNVKVNVNGVDYVADTGLLVLEVPGDSMVTVKITDENYHVISGEGTYNPTDTNYVEIKVIELYDLVIKVYDSDGVPAPNALVRLTHEMFHNINITDGTHEEIKLFTDTNGNISVKVIAGLWRIMISYNGHKLYFNYHWIPRVPSWSKEYSLFPNTIRLSKLDKPITWSYSISPDHVYANTEMIIAVTLRASAWEDEYSNGTLYLYNSDIESCVNMGLSFEECELQAWNFAETISSVTVDERRFDPHKMDYTSTNIYEFVYVPTHNRNYYFFVTTLSPDKVNFADINFPYTLADGIKIVVYVDLPKYLLSLTIIDTKGNLLSGKITINNQIYDFTNGMFEQSLTEGTYTIAISVDGYYQKSLDIDLISDTTKQIVLEHLPYKVTFVFYVIDVYGQKNYDVVSSPHVVVDGVEDYYFNYVSSFTLDLKEGTHTISITDGLGYFESIDTVVDIASDITIELELKKREIPPYLEQYTVTFNLYDVNGNPIDGVIFVGDSAGEFYKMADTVNGTASIKVAGAVTYYYVAYSHMKEPTSGSFSVSSDKALDIILEDLNYPYLDATVDSVEVYKGETFCVKPNIYVIDYDGLDYYWDRYSSYLTSLFGYVPLNITVVSPIIGYGALGYGIKRYIGEIRKEGDKFVFVIPDICFTAPNYSTKMCFAIQPW